MMIKRTICFIMSVVLISLCFGTVGAEELNDTNKSSYDTISYSSDYETYLSSSNFDLADESVTVDMKETTVTDNLSADFIVENSGKYNVLLQYRATGKQVGNLNLQIHIDGSAPFSAFDNLEFPRDWEDSKDLQKDGLGNDIQREQVPIDGFMSHYATDPSGWSCEPYLISLSKGNHTVTVIPVIGEFVISKIVFAKPEVIENYSKPDKSEYYTGKNIIIEGEDTLTKNSYWLTSKSDETSANVYPCSPYLSKINYVGGNWSSIGETITWETPEMKAGYYQLGFNFRQDTLIGSSSYRWLKIDGETPFSEAKCIPFKYKNGWQLQNYSNGNTPYLIYFSAGKHQISLTVTLGEYEEVCDVINKAVDILGDLYMDITMITGETVDVYRDYDLFVQIEDMEKRLNEALKLLKESSKSIKEISGGTTGSYASVIDNMIEIINKMLQNKYSAHRYKTNYYNYYCNLSSTLNDIRSMPLDIDRIYLTAPNTELKPTSGFFSQAVFSVEKFFVSFTTDYNSVDIGADSDKSIEIWVNWGRDQAQVLNTLTKKFTQETDINVNIKITNATVVQAVLSGKGPNVILHSSRAEPVNLAIRNVICDLSEFDDCDEILKRFQKGSEIPYKYKGGLYALPDTQTFYMMYYRKDIFDQLGLEVPSTWDEFTKTIKLLSRNNLYTWLPYTQITDMNQINSGVGALSLFPTLMLQSNLSLYKEDGKSTTLTDNETINLFQKWTDYYTKYKIPVTLNFYNRFRIGSCPLGIDSYTLYNTISAAAPEIDGKWGFTSVPGYKDENGNINRTSAGGGTGCCILKSNKEKELMSWEYLKWWTSADVQLAYSNNIESVLGPTGRIATSNIDAVLNFTWTSEAKQEIEKAWKNVKEVEEVPGSYYLSRSIDHSFWSVVNSGKNVRDMLYKWGDEVDNEIVRKWEQYENR